MGGFSYRLQNVLNIKEKLEEQAKIELGNAINYLNKQENILFSYAISLNNLINEFNQKNGKSILAKELIELNSFIKYYKDEINKQREIVAKAKETVNQKRETLNKALIERKTFENLKETKFEDFIEEEKREATKQMDEINSYNHLFKTRDFR